ncbi:unnamed protein product [Linum tenue]|uniref:Gnk2-homologous domain-containing protein n=1 Tax=Linum tenue TaxID=586396 RepID=A0AAV0IIQ4_9ROSI|nr:unnamed protein product [Linum tenue]
MYCQDWSVGCDAATAADLIEDLKAVVPRKPGEPKRYCNVLTARSGNGLQMYGFGLCSTDAIAGTNATAGAESACRDCLAGAKDTLISRCRDVGAAGQVWGNPPGLCYIKVGPSNCYSMAN